MSDKCNNIKNDMIDTIDEINSIENKMNNILKLQKENLNSNISKEITGPQLKILEERKNDLAFSFVQEASNLNILENQSKKFCNGQVSEELSIEKRKTLKEIINLLKNS